MSIRVIKKDEVFSGTSSVVGKVVSATFAVRQNENAGERYALTSRFDFTGVTEAELMVMATKGLIVDTQRNWRVLAASDAKKATSSNPYELVKVRGLLDSPKTRSAAPATVKAKKLIDGMSEAERAALLAMLLPAEKAPETAPEQEKAA